MDIQYVGEHLQFGRLGNIFIILSFTAAFVSTFAYAFQVYRKKEDPLSWNQIARASFFVHGVSVT